VRDLRARCIIATFDPDTLAQLALTCFVIRGGPIAMGNPVELVEE
jgi:hypothetical protein